jgi:hypothetical protein
VTCEESLTSTPRSFLPCVGYLSRYRLVAWSSIKEPEKPSTSINGRVVPQPCRILFFFSMITPSLPSPSSQVNRFYFQHLQHATPQHYCTMLLLASGLNGPPATWKKVSDSIGRALAWFFVLPCFSPFLFSLFLSLSLSLFPFHFLFVVPEFALLFLVCGHFTPLPAIR